MAKEASKTRKAVEELKTEMEDLEAEVEKMTRAVERMERRGPNAVAASDSQRNVASSTDEEVEQATADYANRLKGEQPSNCTPAIA